MGNLHRRGHVDGCEKIAVRRRCIIIIIIIISRRAGPGACGSGGHFDDRAMRAAHRHVGRARPTIFVGVSRIDFWRNCAGWTMMPKSADQDP
jgi:hypothetical protein